MTQFDSTAFLATLILAVATPAFAADGAITPAPDTDTAIPGAKAVDDISGGAIVDPDRTLERGAIKKNRSTEQPCKKPTVAGAPACASADKDGRSTPVQGK